MILSINLAENSWNIIICQTIVLRCGSSAATAAHCWLGRERPAGQVTVLHTIVQHGAAASHALARYSGSLLVVAPWRPGRLRPREAGSGSGAPAEQLSLLSDTGPVSVLWSWVAATHHPPHHCPTLPSVRSPQCNHVACNISSPLTALLQYYSRPFTNN